MDNAVPNENSYSLAELLEACAAEGVQLDQRAFEDARDLDVESSAHVGGNIEDNSEPQPHYKDLEAEELANASTPSTSNLSKRKNWNKDQWPSEIQRFKRMKGEEYRGYKTVTTENGNRKRSLINVIPERKMGPACSSKNCQRTAKRHCRFFTEEIRQEIHKNFWTDLDWQEKRIFVRGLVDLTSPKFPKIKETSRKSNTFVYYLKLNGVKQQVCRNLFLSTLGIGKYQMSHWVTNVTPKPHDRRKTPKRNFDALEEKAREYLKSLPKLPSHYCRASTSNFYLEPPFNSLLQVFSEYRRAQKELNEKYVSQRTFYYLMDQLKIKIFRPRKDLCDICSKKLVSSIDDDEYNIHITKKIEAQAAKTKDKQAALGDKYHVLTMDLQAVKLAPMLNASSLYYRTKLAVHNFTIYNLGNRAGTCFLWDESEGELTASVFATCIIKFLEENFKDDKDIVLISDGCNYQNRNAVLSNALLDYSIKKKKVIYQKYLEKGHTQMEVDSMHAAIEKQLKGKSIFVPSDYATHCKNARNTPFPYQVKQLSHKDFIDYSHNQYHRYKSIRPGNRVGEDVVCDIRQLKYNPTGLIQYKLNFTETEWKNLPRKSEKKASFPMVPLYRSRLLITKRKYEDLQHLLPVIPAEHHQFFNSLPFSGNKRNKK